MSISRANKSARSRGAVGQDPLCYRMFRENFDTVLPHSERQYSVLDYGAGKNPVHTHKLRKLGYKVVAHDYGDNVTEEHLPDALSRHYDIAIASNVINVQESPKEWHRVLRELSNVADKIIINYPSGPRYLKERTEQHLAWDLMKLGYSVRILSHPPAAPVFLASRY